MECNKDEALRAKDIAVKKFEARDIAGAKKFATKAQNLFPPLEGIGQMIATLDVYLAAEHKVSGEKDWYAIFSVDASTDDDALKKQYRRLALQHHPDKNKSVGAEGAFQLISEAWNVLSDKSKRSLYNQKINVKGSQQKPFHPTKDHCAPKAAANGLYNFAKTAAHKTRAPKRTASVSPSTAPQTSTAPPPCSAPPLSTASMRPTAPPLPKMSNPFTFWTTCHLCNTRYHYTRIYVNHNVICPKCEKPFLAKETSGPINGPNFSVQGTTAPQNLNLNQNATAKASCGSEGMGSSAFQKIPDLDNPKFQWGPFSQAAGPASVDASSTAGAQAANMVHQTYEKVRKERVEAQAAVRKEAALRRKLNASKRNLSSTGSHNEGPGGNAVDREQASSLNVERPPKKKKVDDAGNDFGGVVADQGLSGIGNVGINDFSDFKLFNSTTTSSRTGATSGLFGNSCKSKMTARQGLFKMDIKSMLIQKAKTKVYNKLDEWKAAEEAKSVEEERAKKKQKQKENNKDKAEDTALGDATDKDMLDDSRSIREGAAGNNSSNDHSAEPENEPVSIDVPDPDFHDFDKDRTETSFEGEQIWAIYDEEDSMPRYYALIQKVISSNPFKIRMGYLTSKSNSELGPLCWVASGFTKTCGEFRIGRYETNKIVNIFSHRVRWEKGPRGVIKILPRKGDIWALYRNWSPNWNEHTPDDLIYKYDMVEVLEDYNEEQGVSVTPLLKVSGFKTVFHPHLDPKKVKKIPRGEMFRFSHQIPSIVLTGEEAHNAPKGCYEVDPAATPLELLQVIIEAKDDEVIKIADQQPVS